MGFIPGIKRFFNIYKSMWYTRLTNWRIKKYMIISKVAGKKLDKIQHSFMIKEKKNSPEIRHRGNIPQYN